MKHVSYSEIKIWNECPYKHKLIYIDGLAGFEGNEYTCFGTALHSVCEFGVAGVLDKEDFGEHFNVIFENELKALPAKVERRKNYQQSGTQGVCMVCRYVPVIVIIITEYHGIRVLAQSPGARRTNRYLSPCRSLPSVI